MNQEYGDESFDASLATTVSTEPDYSRDPYHALRFRDFRLLIIGTFIAVTGEQMVSIAIGWELYERTGSALVLGGVGLVQVIPAIILSLPAGHLADQLDRKRIMLIAQIAVAIGSLGLTILSFTRGSIWLIYGCLLLMGGASTFQSPASSALLSRTVPERAYGNAATWRSSSWQLASVIGPALGGLMIAILHSSTLIYGFDASAVLVFAILIALIRGEGQEIQHSERTTLRSLVEGVNFLRGTQVIFAAITLDLFAVLFGGATTLLPIFAKDILHVGPAGLGWLRAAPSIGAVSMAICLAHLPPFKNAGRTLLWAVVGFGMATIIFGLSHVFWLSLLMLFALGAFDNISVVIRGTLLLMRTPDAMRGRISAVHNLFTTASNELGGFESGLVAQLLGPIIAVAGGGVGTILVVLCVALLWPEMRRLGALTATD